jgi:hypothetical protein
MGIRRTTTRIPRNLSQREPDGFGNFRRADGQDGRPDIVSANREDVFFGSAAADQVESFQLGNGNDTAFADGNQMLPLTGSVAWMQGGEGRDQLFAGIANDIRRRRGWRI